MRTNAGIMFSSAILILLSTVYVEAAQQQKQEIGNAGHSAAAASDSPDKAVR